MWARDFNNTENADMNGWRSSKEVTECPHHFDFTIDEVSNMNHDSGASSTHWYITVDKDMGNNTTRRYYGVNIHVRDWCSLFKRELHRLRSNQGLTRYTAVKARTNYWVEPDACEPPIDSSLFEASTEANQKRMVG